MSESLEIVEESAPIHPGAILREEFLEPHRLDAAKLAEDCRVAPSSIDRVLAGEDGLTADLAIRLGRYFGTTPEFWMNLQKHYELEMARAAVGDVDELIMPLEHAAA